MCTYKNFEQYRSAVLQELHTTTNADSQDFLMERAGVVDQIIGFEYDRHPRERLTPAHVVKEILTEYGMLNH